MTRIEEAQAWAQRPMTVDEMGALQKEHELRETLRKVDPQLPTLARLDGRAFHSFTTGMERPFDWRFCEAIVRTAAYLVEESHCAIAYTQSDEITLVWKRSEKGEFIFGGRLQKLCSVLSGLATAKFNQEVTHLLPEWAHRLPIFDCRVWQVPATEVARDNLLWRQADASKNAITMAASAHYSHKQLLNKSGQEKLAMLREVGVDFHSYPYHFRRGTFLRREIVQRNISEDELARIPERHRPAGPVDRSIVARLDANAIELELGL